jgi:hypothetical protein
MRIHDLLDLASHGYDAFGNWLFAPLDKAPGIDKLIAESPFVGGKVIARPAHVHRFNTENGWCLYEDANKYQVWCVCGEFRLYELPEVE